MASAAWTIGVAANPLFAGPAPARANADSSVRKAFIDDLISRMSVEEKVGQLRLVSISREISHAQLADEIAAGRIGATFNTVVRRDNRPLQEAAVRRSRLKIPMAST
jgi:beta-glucosidase